MRRRFVYPLYRHEKVGQRAVTLTTVAREVCQRIVGLVDVPVEGQQAGITVPFVLVANTRVRPTKVSCHL